MLERRGISVLAPADVGGIPEVAETGTTFEANAILKAEGVAAATGMTVFADDSGLVIDALNGDPGVYSARYGTPGLDDVGRTALALKNLRGQSDRTARFVCVIALASPDGLIGTARGSVEGTIADTSRGDCGFGYDPIFIPEGHDLTFGELGPEVKDSMSHRARALQAAIDAGLFDC
jgi:XTP/dITP diphosphohydrolase